ncbi:hypothetical protein [Micromonospora sp. NPDC051006]|uniref:hypothetical protein n=1 Tax=Micromonospora sp. NPDC051006 TaxID=3364283 RepID=UPI00378D4D7C
MHHRLVIRAALVCGLAGVAWCAWSTIDQDAAHARPGHKPHAVEQPGGLLARAVDLPEQAASQAGEAAEEVLDPPAGEDTASDAGSSEPAEPEQGDEDAPTADYPTEHAPESGKEPTGSEPPVTPIGDIIDEVKDELDQVSEQLPTPPILPLPPAAPADETPQQEEQPEKPYTPVIVLPVPPILAPTPPAVPLLDELPVPIGPLLVNVDLEEHAPLGVDPLRDVGRTTPLCADERPADVAHGPGAVWIITDKRSVLPVLRKGAPAKPCPGLPGLPDAAIPGVAAVHHAGHDALSLFAATVPAGARQLALQRLHTLRARSEVPTGWTTHPEPGPA